MNSTESSPADQRLLDTVGQIAEEASLLDTPIKSLRSLADDLASAAREAGGNAQHLREEAEGLKDRLNDLNSRLDDSRGRLKSATTAVAQFNVRFLFPLIKEVALSYICLISVLFLM